MPFKTNINHMVNLDRKATNRKFHSNVYHPSLSDLPNLSLLYPGDRPMEKTGDYKLNIGGFEPTHVHMVKALYSYAKNYGEQNIIDFLVDIFEYGLQGNLKLKYDFIFDNTPYSSNKIRTIIYWLVLQEDINFAKPLRGVRLPFTRYIEACLAARHPNLINIQLVIANTRKRKGAPPPPALIPSLPYYQNILNRINQ